MKNHCFDTLLSQPLHFFFDKTKKYQYCLLYCVYCSDGCTKNSCLE